MYLVLSAFTSNPVSLLAVTKACVFVGPIFNEIKTRLFITPCNFISVTVLNLQH